MAVSVGLIVKEFVFTAEGVEHSIYGRIVETNEIEGMNYRWDISHYYRPTETAATVYRPSSHHTKSSEEAEQLLMVYAEGFTSIDVTPSSYY